MRGSFTFRAFAAVAMLFGFYVLGLLLVAGLLAIPVLIAVFADRAPGSITLLAVGSAIAVLLAIRPRRDRFEPTSPRLTESEQPELFKELKNVATDFSQKFPAEVYLDRNVNAGVMQRGGMMGVGSRRVMFIGLPLMAGVNVDQFRSIIGHEFGHYHSGDTALGPWLYSTRRSIGRAITDLSDRDFVRKPFEVYGIFFLRFTQTLARQQEFTADALSAQKYGSELHSSALRRIVGVSLAYDAYWDQEVTPILQSGYRPPLIEGFTRYLELDAVKSEIERFVGITLQHEVRDIYDSHPTTRDRIDAIAAITGPTSRETDSRPAIDLIRDVPDLEQKLMQERFGSTASRFKPVSWEDIGTVVYLKKYEREAKKYLGALRGLTVSDIPATLADPDGFALRLQEHTKERPTVDRRQAVTYSALTAGLITAMSKSGWQLVSRPGEPHALTRDKMSMLPELAVTTLLSDEPQLDKWNLMALEAGISELDLASSDAAASQAGTELTK